MRDLESDLLINVTTSSIRKTTYYQKKRTVCSTPDLFVGLLDVFVGGIISHCKGEVGRERERER